MSKLEKGSNKLLNAWAFYDWANSVYVLVISSAIFPIFYEALFSDRSHYIHVFGIELKNSALISFVTAFAFLMELHMLRHATLNVVCSMTTIQGVP